jgi:diaminopimelate epimerase
VFTPKGANLTFFRPREDGHIQAVTFERGVDDFTLSCGTGAVAAAEVFKSQHAPNSSGLHIHVPGGKLLVDLRCEQPLLIGPALVIAEIHLIN